MDLLDSDTLIIYVDFTLKFPKNFHKNFEKNSTMKLSEDNLKENNNPLPSSKEMPVIILWVKDK